MRDKSRKIVWILSGVLSFLALGVMYITHREVPFMMDDLWYSTLLYEETPIASLGDIFKAQVWHYNNWGGRSMTHTLLQLILLMGENVADILNIVFTVLLAWVVCLVSGSRKLPAFFAAVSMIIGLNANWKMSMFWQSGAANYLYITVFILAFAYCYLRELPEESEEAVKSLPGIVVWILPLGILTGWSNENMGPALWILSLAVMLLFWRKHKSIKIWMLLGNVSCLVGSILCIVAPGNFVRSSEVAAENYGTLWKLFLRCYGEATAAVNYLFPTLLVLGTMIFVAKYVLKLSLGIQNVILLLTALLSWGAFVLSPHYPDRATFGTMALCICVIISLGKKIVKERSELLNPLMVGMALIWLRGMYFCGEYLAICWGWIR